MIKTPCMKAQHYAPFIHPALAFNKPGKLPENELGPLGLDFHLQCLGDLIGFRRRDLPAADDIWRSRVFFPTVHLTSLNGLNGGTRPVLRDDA